MSERKRPPGYHDGLPATVSEVAELAHGSRQTDDGAAAPDPGFLSPDALDMDLSDPAQRDFGDFELLEKIGRGGMGVVYRAYQRSLDREVALKLLITGPWASERFVERFRLEAQSAARLEHPNIVTVYEGGSRNDLHYFSMRLVRGETLYAVLRRRGSLPAREAAEIMRIVCEAVQYAHSLGVLHLDLKPGNVLIGAEGEPLVADFGLARRLDEALAESSEGTAGTPSYMAPEQADRKLHPISVATDVYGLGCTLYECLCGQPPFIAPTTHGTLQRVLRSDVDAPRVLEPSVPRDLEAICLKCLRKRPAERYESAAAVADELRAFLADRPVSVRRPPPPERLGRWIRREPRLASAVAAVATALVVGLGATFQQWQRAENNASEAQLLTWESRREAALVLEQDGRGDEARDRLLANLREQEEAGEHERAAMERLRLGVLLDRGARLIDETRIPGARPMASRLSPDGRHLAVAFADLTLRWYETATLEELGRISLESVLAPNGTNARWRTSDGQPRLPQLLRFADQNRLLVTFEWILNRAAPAQADTWLVDIGNRTIIEPPGGLTAAAFSANAEWALLRGGDGDIELWQTTPRWRRVDELRNADPQALAWLLSDSGEFAFSLGPGMVGMRSYDLTDEAKGQPVAVPADGVSAWMLSDDGRKLAFGGFDGSAFLLDTDSFAPRRLPTQRGREITWLEFDESGDWLVVSDYDGLVQVVDLSAGDQLVGIDMRAEFTVRRVGVSRKERLVIAAGEGQTALWRLPRRLLRNRPAERIGTAPAAHTQAWRYAADWSLESGLFADAGMDGQMRLWRLPSSPSITATPASQRADTPLFDDDSLVDVEWNRVRLVSRDGRQQTAWLELAQPAGFAGLVDEGRILLVTVGTQLWAYATATMTPLYAPVDLPGTAQRLLATPDGRFVLLSFGEHGDYGHEETLLALDAVDGRWLDGQAVLDGPVHRYAFSPDGDRIVALGPPLGVTTVLKRNGLRVLNEYVHDPNQPVTSVGFQDERLLLLAQAQPDDPNCVSTSAVSSWDPVTDEETRLVVEGDPCRVVTLRSGYALLGRHYDQIVHDDGERIQLPRLVTAPMDGKPITALSPDGRVLARGYRHWVQLYDTASGAPIGLPLFADISSVDIIAELDFVDSGRTLRGRSIVGIELQWSTQGATDDFIVQQIADGNTATSENSNGGRAAAPEPWLPAEARPSITFAHDARAGVGIPARESAAPPWLLDMSAVYNQAPTDFRNVFFYASSSAGHLPMGVQRMGGVDFDIRGLTQLAPIEQGSGTTQQELQCLRLPEVPIAAIHLLAQNGLEAGVTAGKTLAELTLHYVDGTQARVPLRAGIDLWSYSFDDSLVPSVFATFHLMWRTGGAFHEIIAPRIENPRPERIVRCLDVAWLERSGSLTIFAITAEPTRL